MKISEAIKKEAEYAAAMFEAEELERFRSERSFVYRHGAGVSLSCLVFIMAGLYMALAFGSGGLMWISISTVAIAATVLIYTLIRMIRPDESSLKIIARVAIYYFAIATLIATIEFVR